MSCLWHDAEVPEIELDVRLSRSTRRVLDASKMSRMTRSGHTLGQYAKPLPSHPFRSWNSSVSDEIVRFSCLSRRPLMLWQSANPLRHE